MKKRTIKRIALWGTSLFLLLVLVLAVHIYIMTRPKAPDADTRIMARIDIKQPITQEDANRITTWLYREKGVDRVLCNPANGIVVFTFAPIISNGNRIVADLQAALPYKAERFLPSEEEMERAGGCPVAGNSLGYRVALFFKHHF